MGDLQVAAALAGSAAATVAAPTLHSLVADDSRPWRWVVHPDSLDLYADRARVAHPGPRPPGIAPEDRLILLNCGSALHRARIALAADGFAARVTVLPDDDPGHVATLQAGGPIEVTDRARELFVVSARDPRRPVGATHEHWVSDVEIAALVSAAAQVGVSTRVLSRDEVVRLAASTPVTRSIRDRLSRDDPAVYAVLHGELGDPPAWLRAGEALSALWLEATRRGLSVSPSSSVVELRGGRAVMRALLPPGHTPYVAVRVDPG